MFLSGSLPIPLSVVCQRPRFFPPEKNMALGKAISETIQFSNQ